MLTVHGSDASARPGGGAAARGGGRGAPLKPLFDPSPLDGPARNAGVRIALLLRLHRLCDRDGRYRRQADLLEALRAAGHHATTTALSRAESGSYRSSAILRGYEDVLGLEEGALRAVADFLCRRQPAAPHDHDRATESLDVHALSQITEKVQAENPSPADWYAFGRAFRRPESAGLPVATMREALGRLRDSLRVSGGLAWVMEIETILLLGRGPYADLVPAAVEDCPRLGRAVASSRSSLLAPSPAPDAPTDGRSRPVGSPSTASRPSAAEVARTKDRRNREWTWSHQASSALTSAHGLREQPALARLLHDVLADPSEDRALDAAVTLAALPFADDAVGVLRAAASNYPDTRRRHQLARRLQDGWARP